jgi:cytochrome c-type biogenesis protein CcmF
VVVFCIGITLTSVYSTKKDVLLKSGESWSLGGYAFQFEGAKPIKGPNYHGDEGLVIVSHDGTTIAHLKPQKRLYLSQGNPMTEAAIDAGLLRDLFVALGEPRGTQGAWTLRFYHKPFIRWIWLGAIIMAIGGLLALLDKRYRRRGASKQSTGVVK